MINKMHVLDFLEKKNFFYQYFNKLHLYEYLKNKNVFLYCGFDPTENSLHVGHLLPILCLKYFQSFGYTPIALIGGATGMIGDPSFKKYERKKSSVDILKYNQRCLEKQLLFLFNNDACISNKLILLNNYDWFQDISVLSFFRKIGRYFSINEMIHKKSVKKRLIQEKTGMSFTEFSYSLMQAYDFSILYKKYGVKFQIGGSDQAGNILSGIRLIRKLYQDEVFGATHPLLINSNGEKFGKTENYTIWLDSKKTSPYSFYQFWINIPDIDVNKYIQWFTITNLRTVSFSMSDDNKDINSIIDKKIFLADYLTKFIHGKEALSSVKRIIKVLFHSNSIKTLLEKDFLQLLQDGIPYVICSYGINLSHALFKSHLCSSLTHARNMIISGAIRINGTIQTDKNYCFIQSDLLFEKYTLLCRGKKNHVLVHWKNEINI